MMPLFDTRNRFIALLLVIACITLSNSSKASLNIINNEKSYSNFTIDYLYDESNSITINDITNKTFHKEIKNPFALGYRSATAWFKITINNQSTTNKFVLYFTEPIWTSLNLYTYKNKQWTEYKNGLNTPLERREIQSAAPSFPLTITQDETTTLYIKGSTVSSHIGEFKILTYAEFYRPGRITISDAFNMYSGILFFIMLLTSLLYFIMRENLYLYYTGYAFLYIVWISAQNGTYLHIGIPGWDNALHGIGALFVVFLILFSRELMQLKENAPTTEKLFNTSATVTLLCSIGISLNIQEINLFFNIFSSLFFTLLLVTSIRAARDEYFLGANYYLIALIIYMPSMALMTMTYNGFIPNYNITRYAFTIGSLIEILFFSFILANRFIKLKTQKLNAQKELLNEKIAHTESLEKEVTERTRDLNKINSQLLQQTIELEDAKKQLSLEAATDPLSGLSNRRYLLNESVSIFNDAKEFDHPLSILMLDIDRFKGINDNFGHNIGDKAIIACANIFKKHANTLDIVARYGGEEFVILLPQSNIDKALSLAEQIRKDIEQSPICFIDDKKIFLTLSVGVTEINNELDHSIDNMLQRADKALYMAKDKGRNTVVSLKG